VGANPWQNNHSRKSRLQSGKDHCDAQWALGKTMERSIWEPPFSIAQAWTAKRSQTQRDELDSSNSLGGGGANSNLGGQEAPT